MRSAEEWIIYAESCEAVKWTKTLRDVKGFIEEIQQDALEAAAVKACDYDDEAAAEIRAMKPEKSE